MSNLISYKPMKKSKMNVAPPTSLRTVASQTLKSPFMNISQISHTALRGLQLDAQLSDTQMRKIAHFMRNETSCVQIIAPQYEKTLIEHHQLHADLFKHDFFVSRIPFAPHPIVVCTDCEELIRRVAERDGRDVRAIHHSVDSGKDFLKFTLSIEYELPTERKISDMGRRRVLLVAIAPGVKESTEVFRKIYTMLNLPVHQYFHSFHADLKAVAFATGIDGGSSSHPCFACERKITIGTTVEQQLTPAKLRTCANNRRHFKVLRSSGGKKSASQVYNCTADPLPLFPQSSLVITWCRLPQLHLRLHLNWYIHKMHHLKPGISEWYLHFHQKPSDYHGGDFQGPQLRRLSQDGSINYLRNLIVDAHPDVILFFDAMVALINLMKTCFSLTVLEGGYSAELRLFRDACLRLPIKKVPPKMHIIVAHLDRAIRETDRGLGADSEQQFEAAHHDFDVIWQRYIVTDHMNPVYGINFLRAVLTFNSAHTPDIRPT